MSIAGIQEIYRIIRRYRYWILGALAVVLGTLVSFEPGALQDPFLFARAGRRLLSRDWANVFADKLVQVGPLQLAVSGAVAKVADASHVDQRLPLSIFSEVTFTLGTMWLLSLLLRDRQRDHPQGLELLAGLVMLFGGISYTAYRSGQTGEGFIAALWLLTMRESKRSQPERAGLLVGLAAGFKLWGLLGIPFLLFLRDPRKMIRAVAAAGGLAAAIYAPFFLFGTVNTFKLRWLVFPDRPLRFIYGTSMGFTWQMRLVQGAIAASIGVALIALHRRSAVAEWNIPLAIASARLVIDPMVWAHYWLPVQLLGLIGIAMLVALSLEPRRLRIATIAALAAMEFISFGGILLATAVFAISIFASLLREPSFVRAQTASKESVAIREDPAAQPSRS